MAERRKAKAPLDHAPEAVTWARTEAGLTMTQLAEKARVSLSLISEIESGTRNATPARIEQLAEILGVPPEQLRRGRGEQPGIRLAAICVQCSELWEPDHQCPSGRAAGLVPSGAKGAAA